MFENIESAVYEINHKVGILKEKPYFDLIMSGDSKRLDVYESVKKSIETALQKDKEYHEESVTYHQACVMEFLVKLDQLRMQSQNPEVQEAYRMAESLFKAAFDLW